VKLKTVFSALYLALSSTASLIEHSIERVLLGWRAHFGEPAILNVENRSFELAPSCADTLDLVVVVIEAAARLLEAEELNRLVD
jgi:hypothetical protein